MKDDRELFAKYRATGDLTIRNQIVEKYLYIAGVLARKFVGRGVDYDDLYQVATLALIKGVDRFDETLGLQFSTYITPTITGEIKNYFRDHSRLVHVPRRVYELRGGIKRTTDEYLAEFGRKPTAKELSERLNVSEEEILRCAEAGGLLSLDGTTDSDDGSGMSLYEMIPDTNDVFEEIETRDAVESAVKTLSDTEQTIVKCRFKDGLSQSDTARILGVSQMNVSRLERKILQKLRDVLQKNMA